MSGYQDSNLGPPAPKAGALTGLRYIPKKIQFNSITNFLPKALQRYNFILNLQSFSRKKITIKIKIFLTLYNRLIYKHLNLKTTSKHTTLLHNLSIFKAIIREILTTFARE